MIFPPLYRLYKNGIASKHVPPIQARTLLASVNGWRLNANCANPRGTLRPSYRYL